jgi:hypothetical protein
MSNTNKGTLVVKDTYKGNGQGLYLEKGLKTCERCSGSGQYKWAVGSGATCGYATGTCYKCNGTGSVLDQQALAFAFPNQDGSVTLKLCANTFLNAGGEVSKRAMPSDPAVPYKCLEYFLAKAVIALLPPVVEEAAPAKPKAPRKPRTKKAPKAAE